MIEMTQEIDFSFIRVSLLYYITYIKYFYQIIFFLFQESNQLSIHPSIHCFAALRVAGAESHSVHCFPANFCLCSTVSLSLLPFCRCSNREAIFHHIQSVPSLVIWLGRLPFLWLGGLLLWLWQPHHHDGSQSGPVPQDLPSQIWYI